MSPPLGFGYSTSCVFMPEQEKLINPHDLTFPFFPNTNRLREDQQPVLEGSDLLHYICFGITVNTHTSNFIDPTPVDTRSFFLSPQRLSQLRLSSPVLP